MSNGFVTSEVGDVYCIHGLPPEVLAVLFAYVSRSPKSFRENLASLLADGSLSLDLATAQSPSQTSQRVQRFHEKWVVGYGHSSVAEHADLKIAVDRASILAAASLVDCRLASYTEKSTRYQVYGPESCYTPDGLSEEIEALYRESVARLFAAYRRIYDEVLDTLTKTLQCPDNVDSRAWRSTLHARACDSARYALPLATHTALGISMNARTAANSISKWLSSPVPEVADLGEQILGEAKKVCPTLLRHARARTGESLSLPPLTMQRGSTPSTEESCISDFVVVGGASSALPVFVASLYERYAPDTALNVDQGNLQASLCETLGTDGMRAILRSALAGVDQFSAPPRELEHISVRFGLTVDYGAYRDIRRHRMCTQTTSSTVLPSFDLGFAFPPDIDMVSGGREWFTDVMMGVREEAVMLGGLESQYLVPLAYRCRALVTMNLRELYQFIRLRSSPEGHASYRAVALALHQRLGEVLPEFAECFPCGLVSPVELPRLDSEVRLSHKLGLTKGA